MRIGTLPQQASLVPLGIPQTIEVQRFLVAVLIYFASNMLWMFIIPMEAFFHLLMTPITSITVGGYKEATKVGTDLPDAFMQREYSKFVKMLKGRQDAVRELQTIQMEHSRKLQ